MIQKQTPKSVHYSDRFVIWTSVILIFLFFQTFRIVDVQREDRGIYQVMALGLYDQVVMKTFQLDLGGEL